MGQFIEDVLKDLIGQEVEFSELTFILPSKRARLYLLKTLSSLSAKTQFAPDILSIEEFISELSQLEIISNSELLFRFYSVYLETESISLHDDFESFMGWSQTLLNDFNELDRYLIDPEKILNYLGAIKDLDHWSTQTDHTPLIRDYKAFWNSLYELYSRLTQSLLQDQVGYQGLQYREAVSNLENYIQANQGRRHIFMGFNALNQSESTIIQELLVNDLADIYWDIDEYFLKQNKHSAGHFMREIRQRWRHFESHPFKWTHEHYTAEKKIHLVATSSQIIQAKHASQILDQLRINNPELDRTALLLGDESILTPVLSGLSPEIKGVNITMGFPLTHVPITGLIDAWFRMQLKSDTNHYFKDVIEILNHPMIYDLYKDEKKNNAQEIINSIREKNLTFLSLNDIQELGSNKIKNLSGLIFSPWKDKVELAMEAIKSLILHFRTILVENREKNKLALEYLYKYYELLNSIESLTKTYPHLNSVSAFYKLFKQLRQNEKLDFQGEPLQGLQIMGILESRVIDFETVIITSVNEGILPAGRHFQSFIPLDLKREFGLPTYFEKDAVYAYHFFHLLQRAKEVYILYGTETDALNRGEKSRFLTMMEIEGIHKLEKLILRPAIPRLDPDPREIIKTSDLLYIIQKKMMEGISPSALLQYIRNPIDFYKNFVLGIRDAEEVEEVVAAKTLGTVIHETLREIYAPFVGNLLNKSSLEEAKNDLPAKLNKHFLNFFRPSDLSKGKNLITKEIAAQYIRRFLDSEIKSLSQGNQIKILGIEQDVVVEIDHDKLPFAIKLKGQIDRVDEFNGLPRVIDYKTGKVESKEVELIDWEELTTDYKSFGKSFQVLMYSYILNKLDHLGLPCEAGIISFKNLNSGFLKFTKKDKSGHGAKKDSIITAETLTEFESQLIHLLKEIVDPHLKLTEKPV